MSEEASTTGVQDTTGTTPNGTPQDLTPAWVKDKPDEAYKTLQETRAEAAASRLKAKEATDALETYRKEAERSKLDEVGRLKAELEDLKTSRTELEKQVTVERYRAQLAGRVVSVEDALELLSDDFVKDGNIQVDKFLEAKPFLALPATGKPTVKNLNPGTKSGSFSMDGFIRNAVGKGT